MKFTLGKDKKLKSRKRIERLFVSGKRIQEFPLKAVYFTEPSDVAGFQLAVSVPKKLFKRATDRNLLKRRMREAFRIHQEKLKLNSKLEIMFIYSAHEILDFDRIESAMLVLIDSLNLISIDNNSEK